MNASERIVIQGGGDGGSLYPLLLPSTVPSTTPFVITGISLLDDVLFGRVQLRVREKAFGFRRQLKSDPGISAFLDPLVVEAARPWFPGVREFKAFVVNLFRDDASLGSYPVYADTPEGAVEIVESRYIHGPHPSR